MKPMLLFSAFATALIASTTAQAEPIHWAGPPKLPPIPTTELSCPVGARLMLTIQDTKGPLIVHVNNKYAFIVSPFWKRQSTAVLVAQPDGWVGARPPATMELTPLTGPTDANVYIKTNLDDQPNGGTKLRGYIGCDRWQAAITDEDGAWYSNFYAHTFVLKRN